jgi:hypothetical protein
MLERLDDTDWAALDHAYGPADDVPDLLRALLSEDEEARRRAWQTLYGNVIHQGTVWEVTPHVVPFLIEMLEGDAPEPARVLRYLAALAEGTGDDGEDDSFYEDAPELARHRGAPARTREAVRQGLHVYRAYTTSPDAACRTEAANLVGLLGAETADELVQRYLAETDEVARAATLWSLRIAIPAASEGGIPDALSSPSALVRLVEALSMIRCEPTERALEVIAGVLGDPGNVPRYSELPIARFRIELDIAQHIRAAPPFAPGAVLPALIATMHRFSGPAPFVAARIADAVLHLVFEPVEPARLDPSRVEIRAVSELNATQREVLHELLRARPMWGEPGRLNGTLASFLHPRGLPSDWATLRDYLSATVPS